MFNKLTDYLRREYQKYGFDEVITPTIYKKSLWEKSGHWENYAEDMYSVTGRGASGENEGRQVWEDEEYGLKPMNCPGHCLIFASKQRSYRDLPIRYADFSPLHRNEVSGALSGLTRVRRFHQDDGHIFCRPSQIKEEISKTLQFVEEVYKVLGLGPYRLALSTRPKDHFIGTVEEWHNAESGLRECLEESKQPWTVNEEDGAFYGPKIDIILKDSDGKEHQTATIQLDFQLPKRFELEYQAPAPDLEQKGLTTNDPELLAVQGPVTPVLIHRAVLGSVERMMALLIEHYNGKWPFWLQPRQMIILTINDQPEVINFARRSMEFLKRVGGLHSLSVHLDASSRPLKKKISEAKRKHYGIIAVIGQNNVDVETLNVDFSGLTIPELLVRHPTLKGHREVDKTMSLVKEELPAANIKLWIEIWRKVFSNQRNYDLPDLKVEDLKNIEVRSRDLRRLIRQLQETSMNMNVLSKKARTDS
jgi:threonyl-tRNA synthetase